MRPPATRATATFLSSPLAILVACSQRQLSARAGFCKVARCERQAKKRAWASADVGWPVASGALAERARSFDARKTRTQDDKDGMTGRKRLPGSAVHIAHRFVRSSQRTSRLVILSASVTSIEGSRTSRQSAARLRGQTKTAKVELRRGASPPTRKRPSAVFFLPKGQHSRGHLVEFSTSRSTDPCPFGREKTGREKTTPPATPVRCSRWTYSQISQPRSSVNRSLNLPFSVGTGSTVAVGPAPHERWRCRYHSQINSPS